MEHLLNAMGYQLIRKQNFELVTTVTLESLLPAAEFIAAILFMEFDWEQSISAFNEGRTEGARFRITRAVHFHAVNDNPRDRTMTMADIEHQRAVNDEYMQTIRETARNSGIRFGHQRAQHNKIKSKGRRTKM